MTEPHSTKKTGGIWGVRTPFAPSRFPFFYGWVIVFAATIGSIFSIPGQTMGFSVFTDVLIEELGLSRVQLSLAYCLGTEASGLTLQNQPKRPGQGEHYLNSAVAEDEKRSAF